MLGKKYVIVPDSFKGCLSSSRVAEAAAEGVRAADSEAHITSLTVSDGGEGMLDAVTHAVDAEEVICHSYDPLMRRIDVRYAGADRRSPPICPGPPPCRSRQRRRF